MCSQCEEYWALKNCSPPRLSTQFSDSGLNIKKGLAIKGEQGTDSLCTLINAYRNNSKRTWDSSDHLDQPDTSASMFQIVTIVILRPFYATDYIIFQQHLSASTLKLILTSILCTEQRWCQSWEIPLNLKGCYNKDINFHLLTTDGKPLSPRLINWPEDLTAHSQFPITVCSVCGGAARDPPQTQIVDETWQRQHNRLHFGEMHLFLCKQTCM